MTRSEAAHERLKAREAGAKTYHGVRHAACGTTLKYLHGACVKCLKASNRTAAKKEWAKQYNQRTETKERQRRRNNTPEAKQQRPNKSLMKLYGITQSQYRYMEMTQQSTCAICDRMPTGKPLFVDHNHKTGAVRGLLCSNCNIVIGLIAENTTFLRNAITYLETSN